MTRFQHALFALVVLAGLSVASPASSQTSPAPWSQAFPALEAAVRSGHPLVVVVVVPLCSNEQINCGASWAGQAGRLETNLYWGAIFGAKRFFLRPRGGWDLVDLTQPGDGVLEQAVFRRRAPAAPWQGQGQMEQITVLQAVHGDQIDQAVDKFWNLATQGGVVHFQDGDRVRTEAVSVVGYAGHNRLMDGKRLPAAASGGHAIPSFVLACLSERYFGERLRAAGSATLLMTRALMAPEGYLLDATLRALGDNLPLRRVRAAAVDASQRWQRLPRNEAEWVFTPVDG